MELPRGSESLHTFLNYAGSSLRHKGFSCGTGTLKLRCPGLGALWHMGFISPTKDWTLIPCMGRQILNHWDSHSWFGIFLELCCNIVHTIALLRNLFSSPAVSSLRHVFCISDYFRQRFYEVFICYINIGYHFPDCFSVFVFFATNSVIPKLNATCLGCYGSASPLVPVFISDMAV